MPALHTLKERSANQEHCELQAPASNDEGHSLHCWNLNHHLACALKYISRAGRKDDEEKDLQKAICYPEHRLQILQQDKQSRPFIQFDDKKGATVLQRTLNYYHKENKTSNPNTFSRSPRYISAWCSPLHRVVSVPQLRSWTYKTHPLFQQVRFYCPESCCQASWVYESESSSFVIRKGARHARECRHYSQGEDK